VRSLKCPWSRVVLHLSPLWFKWLKVNSIKSLSPHCPVTCRLIHKGMVDFFGHGNWKPSSLKSRKVIYWLSYCQLMKKDCFTKLYSFQGIFQDTNFSLCTFFMLCVQFATCTTSHGLMGAIPAYTGPRPACSPKLPDPVNSCAGIFPVVSEILL
jgi:hypothetical protein